MDQNVPDEFILIQDEFEMEEIPFSELDPQAQSELRILSEFGYGRLGAELL